MPEVIAFDVNETLLELSALDPLFERAFGDAAVRPLWFGQMLQLAFTGVITNDYVNFTDAQHAALSLLGRRRGIEISDATANEIVGAMEHLPAYPDVRPGLELLRSSGFKVAALTNSILAVAEAQLRNAGLRDLFDAVLSADQVERLKPAPEPYKLVANTFATTIDNVRLVAAHAWDISGALATGAAAAFVARPGMFMSPLGRQPDIVGADIREVAELVVAP